MFKIVLIGLGSIGQKHLLSLAKSNLSIIVYTYDINTKNLQKAKKIWLQQCNKKKK